MNPRYAVLIVVVALFAFSGCTAVKAGATRKLPATTYPVKTEIPEKLKTLGIAIEPFDTESTDIGGGHYEGLLQVRQPWFFGLSAEQKNVLYGNLREVTKYALIDEFVRQGFRVHIPEAHRAHLLIPKDRLLENETGAALKITGRIRSIELNTYGRGLGGTMEGMGSSGNYWETEIAFSDVSVVDRRTGVRIWNGEFKTYCKLENCPMKLDWTMLTLITKSLDSMKGLSKGPLGMVDAVYGFRADYLMEPADQTPPDIAARIGSLTIVDRIRQAGPP